MKITTTSPQQTKGLARLILKKISRARERAKKTNQATIIALEGELGSGKTIFTQGFARALGIKRRVTSPTFLIIRNYKLPRLRQNFGGQAITNYKFLYHIDCYRIKKPKELLSLNFKNIIADSKNIVVVEWAEKIKNFLPKSTIWINFEHGQRENERNIKISKP